MRVSAYIATSLDGFIARENGDLDWLDRASKIAVAEDPNEDYGFIAFLASVDRLVMGRKTFEFVEQHPDWAYGDTPVTVLSTTMDRIQSPFEDKAECYSGTITALYDRLADEGCERIYVDGGQTIRSFLREGLLDDITITTIPVLLGHGLPLFRDTDGDVPLIHRSTTSYPSGFVQSCYEVSRDAKG